MLKRSFILIFVCCLIHAQESKPAASVLPASRPASEVKYVKIGDLPGVQSVVKYSDRLYRGAQPQNVQGMLELKKLGVTTILSVEEPDAAELQAAKEAGLQVINIPTLYDGFPSGVLKDLVDRYRALDGVVFTHCHHGKHRGGTASAILRMTFEGISQLEALQEMAELGCSKRYSGLYETVRTYRPDPATAHRVLGPEPGIEGLIEVTPRILRGTSALTPEGLASLKRLGVRSILSADLAADAAERARAAGFDVTIVAANATTDGARATVMKALREKDAEKVMLHATADPAKVAALVAYCRIGISLWSLEEAAREVEALVPGDRGAEVAGSVRGIRARTGASNR